MPRLCTTLTHLLQVKGNRESGPSSLVHGGVEMQCTSCGGELFYLCKSAKGEPQFVCTACGQRHSAEIERMSVAMRPAPGFYLPREPEGEHRH